jgi:hypothetical protein
MSEVLRPTTFREHESAFQDHEATQRAATARERFTFAAPLRSRLVNTHHTNSKSALDVTLRCDSQEPQYPCVWSLLLL